MPWGSSTRRTGRCRGCSRALESEDRIEVAQGLAVQGALQAYRGQAAESAATEDRALAMATRVHLVTSPNWIELPRHAIEALLRDGRPGPALEAYERFLSRRAKGADSADLVPDLRLGGWAYLDAGQPAKALPILERALALGALHPVFPAWLPRLRYQVARALVETRGDRKRAEALAQAAHDEVATAAVRKDLLAEIDSWRAKAFASR